MTKKKYVEGNIIVETPYFKSQVIGAYYPTCPVGAKIIPTNKIINGEKFLVINDDNPLSMFNEYYAQGEFTFYYIGTEYLNKSYKDVYKDYEERKFDFKDMIDISGITEQQKDILNRMIYLSFVASFETLIYDIVIVNITHKEENFNNYFDSTKFYNKKELTELKKEGNAGIWEKKVVDAILKISFSNVKTIINSFNVLFNKEFKDNDDQLDDIFQKRHLLAHKNGRYADGKLFTPTKSDIEKLIADLDTFVDQVMNITKKQSQ